MLLYQHLCRCSVAMQYFLDENPDYWLFIPQRMTDNEEQQQEREITSVVVDNNQYQYANDVPTPSNRNYHFTIQQKLAIEKFFQQKKYLYSINNHFDLYESQIIAVCKCIESDFHLSSLYLSSTRQYIKCITTIY